MADARRVSKFGFLRGDRTMRRLLSLPGLAIATWASCLALLGLLGIMLAVLARHPHFLPVMCVLAMAIIAGLALIVGALWRIIRGPGRREALSWLLLGSAPLWFLGGSVFYGLAIGNSRQIPINLAIMLMAPLGESMMDLEARFCYPQRTVGEKVVMISAPMPVEEARAAGGDGPSRPRARGAAGSCDHRFDPLGSRAVAGHRAPCHVRPVYGDSAGRGARRCRGPQRRRSPRGCALRAHEPLFRAIPTARPADRGLGPGQSGRRPGRPGH